MKKAGSYLLAALVLIGALAGCGAKDGGAAKTPSTSTKTPVVLNEVAHSIFYAPMYVAIEKGYFAEEGIDLTLVTGFGADKTMTALLTGEADIGFMGSSPSGQAISWFPENRLRILVGICSRAKKSLADARAACPKWCLSIF